jgi:hypothetical protein
MTDWKKELDANAQAAQDAAEKADVWVKQERINAEPQWRYVVQRIIEDVVCHTYNVSASDDAEAISVADQIGASCGEHGGRLVILSKTGEENDTF